MRSCEKQTVERIGAFRKICTAFGVQWRAVIGHVSPKVHLIESHLADQFLKLRCLGLFSEDPIERLHHSQGVQIQRWASIRDNYTREEHIEKTAAVARTTACRELALEVGQKTKRNFSEEALERRRQRGLVDEAAKNSDIEAIIARYTTPQRGGGGGGGGVP
jgi:hypothetical protein